METVSRSSGTLWKALMTSARSMGKSPALLSPQQGIALSYDQLRCQAQGLSKGLEDRGVGLGDSVITDIPNVAEGMLLHLACARLGAAIATAKDVNVLSTIPSVRCAVTASNDSWLSQHALSAPPIIAGGDEMNSMLNLYDVDDPDDDDQLIDRHASLRPLGYFGSSKPLTHESALKQGEDMKQHLKMDWNDRVCVSITLYHAFGIGSACSSALLSGAAIVLPAVGGLRGCGVPSQRAETTLNTLISEKCTLLFADTHTLKALHDEALSEALSAADLSNLRGGVCKTGSGSDILSETVDLKGIKLSTLGKRGD